jgi:hypothetical protein
LKWKSQPEIWIPNHRGIERKRVITRCLVGVKMYGRRPDRFIEAININNLRKIR